jgi:hypothetical protein
MIEYNIFTSKSVNSLRGAESCFSDAGDFGDSSATALYKPLNGAFLAGFLATFFFQLLVEGISSSSSSSSSSS